jgi:hypothetical protein
MMLFTPFMACGGTIFQKSLLTRNEPVAGTIVLSHPCSGDPLILAFQVFIGAGEAVKYLWAVRVQGQKLL